MRFYFGTSFGVQNFNFSFQSAVCISECGLIVQNYSERYCCRINIDKDPTALRERYKRLEGHLTLFFNIGSTSCVGGRHNMLRPMQVDL